MAIQPTAKCSIVSVSGPEQVTVGQPVTISCVLQNTGDSWGPIRVEPGIAWPGWSLVPGWLQLEPDAQGTISLTIDSWVSSVQLNAVHWNYDTEAWDTDSTQSWPGGNTILDWLYQHKWYVIGGGAAVVAGILVLAMVKRK